MSEIDNIISEAYKLQGVLSKMDKTNTHSGLFDLLGEQLRKLRLEYMKHHNEKTLDKIKKITLKINSIIKDVNKYESHKILELLKEF